MKKTAALALVASLTVLTGCVPITYTKSVTVQKDAKGNVISITEYEGITEPHSETPRIQAVGKAMPLNHLK